MTILWGILWAVLAGLFIWYLGGRTDAALPVAALGVLAMAVCVVFWRMFRDPG
jgi:hypothetical protein